MPLVTGQPSTDSPTEPPDPVTPRRRWPIGTLTVIGIAAVVAGGLLLGNLGSDTTATTTELPFTVEEVPGAAVVPTLPAAGAQDTDGEQAADFTVGLFDGSLFSLSGHQQDDGRPVFLNLWASWCPPCREEMPAINQASLAHPEVLFIGVAVEDDPVAAEEFGQEIGVSYPLAVEESDFFIEEYGYFGLPAAYLISADGIIVSKIFGGVDEEDLNDLILEYFGS